MRSIVLLVTLSGSVVYAQDISGNWQGTLQAGKELRIVVNISKADGAGLKATMYSIDQGATWGDIGGYNFMYSLSGQIVPVPEP